MGYRRGLHRHLFRRAVALWLHDSTGPDRFPDQREEIDTEAANLYIAAATYLNADEAANPANVTKDEALKRKVWADYQAVDAAYKSGAILTVAILATLTADL